MFFLSLVLYLLLFEVLFGIPLFCVFSLIDCADMYLPHPLPLFPVCINNQ